ncbi:MAG: rhomboid family intramembrane serine protease [Acidobacteria bacterium]|nr:MAG: rhomboid family intramembrane serine protease [Acidobacteriota bacterium]
MSTARAGRWRWSDESAGRRLRLWDNHPMSFHRGPYAGGVGLAFPPVTPMVRRILWTLGGGFAAQVLLTRAGFTFPVDLFALHPRTAVPFVWQFVTYALLHGGLWHLLMNMLGVWMFGGDVERVLGSNGLLRYVLVCVTGGGVAHVLFGFLTGGAGTVMGASAGVLGLVLAFALMFPERQMFLFPIPVPIRARTVAILFGVIDLYGAIDANPLDPVAHLAHLGGMAAGYLYLKGFIRPGGWFARLRRGRGARRPFRVIEGERRSSGWPG